jgi:hypothetical protein
MSGADQREEANASEVAQAMVKLISDHRAVPQQAAEDLARLLGHDLAAPSAGARRQARLGLLIDLVSDGQGLFIPSTAYDEAREARAAAGEDWPTSSSLARVYGHWLVAVKAACRYWYGGGPQRVPSSHAHARPQRGYQPQEIRRALWECQRELELPDGVLPTQWEYQEWAQIKRLIARRAGSKTRVPGLKQIRKAYGSYSAAASAIVRLENTGSQGDEN